MFEQGDFRPATEHGPMQFVGNELEFWSDPHSAGERLEMTKSANDDRRLARLSKICLAFPETRREDHGSHASFLVRKKTFAYFLDDHHGDGIVSVCCKTALAGNEELVRDDPHRFYIPAYIGPRGWVALRLDVGAIDWTEVADLARESYGLVAPKRLAALVAVG